MLYISPDIAFTQKNVSVKDSNSDVKNSSQLRLKSKALFDNKSKNNRKNNRVFDRIWKIS